MSGELDLQVLDEEKGLFKRPRQGGHRAAQGPDSKDIPWRDHNVSLVADCTGRLPRSFAEADSPKGSLRGHLAAGARVVGPSSPFKSK